ncbi:hypothetical protein CLG96_12200 [Sphingomonas oleivorans]|uniref:Uncharacterized protein n=1 Tax=Sphingomonas oleivorans TaxID=1735121 RepID=A0A2T5FWY4_9SPHN|nr:hypothetical protein [Sphingomonas oleivorans]PTQ10293.1 hypothetical protein CLG96_12200 [Sphingomonas oleivorans]
MASPSTPPTRAHGIFIALGALAGAFIGIFLGQPSAGLLIGLGLGVAFALALWLFDRSRER